MARNEAVQLLCLLPANTALVSCIESRAAQLRNIMKRMGQEIKKDNSFKFKFVMNII